MVATKQHSAKERFNRIFSIVGLTIGGIILVGLMLYVQRTMDLKTVLEGIRPLWLAGAALCIPVSESIDGLIFTAWGRQRAVPSG